MKPYFQTIIAVVVLGTVSPLLTSAGRAANNGANQGFEMSAQSALDTLSIPQIQSDLALSVSDIERIKTMEREYRDSSTTKTKMTMPDGHEYVTNIPDAKQLKKLDALDKKYREQLSKLLSRGQSARLSQIARQLEGPSFFVSDCDPDSQFELRLSAEQRRAIEKVFEAAFSDNLDINQADSIDSNATVGERRKYVERKCQRNADAVQKIRRVLTLEQSRKYDKLIGKPIDLKTFEIQTLNREMGPACETVCLSSVDRSLMPSGPADLSVSDELDTDFPMTAQAALDILKTRIAQTDLSLRASEIERIKTMEREYRGSSATIIPTTTPDGLQVVINVAPDAEYMKRFDLLEKYYHHQLCKLLSREKLARLCQIGRQMEVPGFDPRCDSESRRKITLSANQEREFRMIDRQYWDASTKDRVTSGLSSNGTASDDDIQKFKERNSRRKVDAAQKVRRVLTAEQLRKYDELLGKPFDAKTLEKQQLEFEPSSSADLSIFK